MLSHSYYSTFTASNNGSSTTTQSERYCVAGTGVSIVVSLSKQKIILHDMSVSLMTICLFLLLTQRDPANPEDDTIVMGASGSDNLRGEGLE